jgi:hypothetical protein
MILEHIKTKVCRECGAPVIAETKDLQHTNGQWNESRTFKCGAIIEYSPNFKSERDSTKCPRSPRAITKQMKRHISIQRLEKYIKKLDVDESFKVTIWSHVPQYLGTKPKEHDMIKEIDNVIIEL